MYSSKVFLYLPLTEKLKMLLSVEKYCQTILTTTKCHQLPFHNLEHTLEVVKNIQTIGTYANLTQEELEPVVIAGWFHDLGFCEVYQGHEEVSIQLARAFLTEKGYEPALIEIVTSCIAATKIPQNPKHTSAEIIVDADIFHIGTDAFFYRKLLLRREWETVLNQTYTDLEWHTLNLKFLQEHNFFTPYGKTVLLEGCKRNEERVNNLIALY